MTEIWLVRHGQTEWNLEGRYQGSRDIELNENGLEQARQTAEQLKDVGFTAVYSSPLSRAYQTALMIAKKQSVLVNTDNRLVEVSLGEWEGMLSSDIRQQYPHEIEERQRNPLHARPPGGESAAEVAKRMAAAVNDISRVHPVGPVLLVSHGLALASLICQAQDIPQEKVYDMVPENADPIIIQWEQLEEDKSA